MLLGQKRCGRRVSSYDATSAVRARAVRHNACASWRRLDSSMQGGQGLARRCAGRRNIGGAHRHRKAQPTVASLTRPAHTVSRKTSGERYSRTRPPRHIPEQDRFRVLARGGWCRRPCRRSGIVSPPIEASTESISFPAWGRWPVPAVIEGLIGRSSHGL